MATSFTEGRCDRTGFAWTARLGGLDGSNGARLMPALRDDFRRHPPANINYRSFQ